MNQQQVDQHSTCKLILVVQVVKCQNKLKLFTGLFSQGCFHFPQCSVSYTSLLADKDVVHMHKCGGVQSLDGLMCWSVSPVLWHLDPHSQPKLGILFLFD